MADIGQSPGELNINPVVRGDDYAFQLQYAGDVTADTFVGTIHNIGGDVLFGITKSVTVTPDPIVTTLTLVLTAAKTALMTLSLLPWNLTRTSSGAVRTEIVGQIGFINK